MLTAVNICLLYYFGKYVRRSLAFFASYSSQYVSRCFSHASVCFLICCSMSFHSSGVGFHLSSVAILFSSSNSCSSVRYFMGQKVACPSQAGPSFTCGLRLSLSISSALFRISSVSGGIHLRRVACSWISFFIWRIWAGPRSSRMLL